jgi:hypothetical protein
MKKIINLLTLLLLLTSCGENYQDKAEEMGKEVLKSLEAKYHEEFELESSEYIRENRSYAIFVHPKENPEMSVRVLKWAMGGYSLSDDYIRTIRGVQMTKLFEKDINNISKKKLYYAVIGNPSEVEKEYYNMNYSIEDILKNNQGKTYIGVEMFFFYDITPENLEETCKRVYELIRHIQELKPKTLKLSISFYDEAYFKYKDVVWIEKEKMGKTGMCNFENYYTNKYLKSVIVFKGEGVVGISLDELNEIKSYKDIEKKIYFKKFNGQFFHYGGDEMYDWVDVDGNMVNKKSEK